MHAVAEELTKHQRLLVEIRDKLCGGNAAQLARQLNKDPTYVNRLFYPEGKPGRKGIGLEIMTAANRAFFLPVGFWDMNPPALDPETVQELKSLQEARSAVENGTATPEQAEALEYFERLTQKADRRTTHVAQLRERRERLRERLAETDEMLLHRGAAAEEPRAAYGMEPILAWEHPDDLPPGEFVMVPRLDVHLSAGGGREQVEIELVKENPQAFRTEWIRQQRLKPGKLAAMRASGESMEPTIHDGDSLLVDTSQTQVTDGKVYALWYDGGERVKRLFRLPGGGLRIKSDNPGFDSIELPPDSREHVRIIGRVVHRSGVGGL